ncbi:MAG: hypothetical protein CMH82_12715, partial [Nocardioides sp.]|nr:hypothetical protein [Nocardioides sp.]
MSRGWGGQGQAAAYAATCARLCAGAHPALLSALRPLTGRRVLDVGAGDGRLARILRGAGAHVVAVDPDPDMAGLTVGLPDLPFEDGAFDLVVAAFVVNHLDDPRAGVAELARVTAPGGRVLATIWPSGANAQSRMWQRVLDAVAGSTVVVPLIPDTATAEPALAAIAKADMAASTIVRTADAEVARAAADAG